MSSGSRSGVTAVAVAVIAALASLLFPQPRDLLIATLDLYQVPVPELLLSSQPTVYDASKEIKYVGASRGSVEHFQNIFYAEDTTAKNRFAPPVPHVPKPGSTVDATSPGAWCPQGVGDVLPFTSKVVNISENCLSLRIARPRGVKPHANLPVLVWMHGGGHALGSAYEMLYTPDGLVKQAVLDKQPVIYVAINYRLGIFGFAASKALTDAKHTNAGLRDQRAAFEWVRDNIAAFGGNPQNVTAIGQSVGASDIGLQLTAFGGEKGAPFQKAVMMSGAPGLVFNVKSDEVATRTAEVAASLGCVTDDDSQSTKTLACLRAAPWEKLTDLSVTAMRAARPPFGEAFFFPTSDGDFIPDRPSLLTRKGRFVKGVPIVTSWVSNEGAWYASPTTATDEEVTGSFQLWLHGLSKSTLSRLLQLYPLSDFEHMVRPEDGAISPQYYRAAQMNRDLWFVCPVMDFTWQYTKNGGPQSSNVRLYEHNATRFGGPFGMMGVPMWRVAHLSDIPYVFNGHVEAGGDNSEAQKALSRLLSSSIARFVNVADPAGGRHSVTEWPSAFHSASKEALTQDSPAEVAFHLFGGPYGSGPVTARKDVGKSESLGDRERAVANEKIFERCAFINSDEVRAEIDV